MEARTCIIIKIIPADNFLKFLCMSSKLVIRIYLPLLCIASYILKQSSKEQGGDCD